MKTYVLCMTEPKGSNTVITDIRGVFTKKENLLNAIKEYFKIEADVITITEVNNKVWFLQLKIDNNILKFWVLLCDTDEKKLIDFHDVL